MIDTFSWIPFDLPHLIFKVDLAIKYHFFLKEFLLKFKEADATTDPVRFYTLTSNLHSDVIFDVTAIKTNVT